MKVKPVLALPEGLEVTAIEMIDEIFENDGSDVPIKTAFINALGVENGTRIFEHVLTNNPRFNENTTRLQVRGITW